MKHFDTEQEKFWAGKFGDEYIKRNNDPQIIAVNLNLFSKIIQNMGKIGSVIEFGANVGLNIKALMHLLPQTSFHAVEINKNACNDLAKINGLTIYNESILSFTSVNSFDIVFSKGVLIHINPNELPSVYKKMYEHSRRYILIAEYYNPTPVDIDYRGISGKLFKRDFAGEILDKYKDLELVDYGFSYHRDNNFPQDDINWFLLKKTEINL